MTCTVLQFWEVCAVCFGKLIQYCPELYFWNLEVPESTPSISKYDVSHNFTVNFGSCMQENCDIPFLMVNSISCLTIVRKINSTDFGNIM